jgi:membrane-associated protease RseP (regulator of RpoE activity)
MDCAVWRMLSIAALIIITCAGQARAASGERAWIGVSIAELTTRQRIKGGQRGASVVNVNENSPAASAGIKVGDVIVALGDRAVANTDELLCLMIAQAAGSALRFTIVQSGERHLVVVISKPWPSDLPPTRHNCPMHISLARKCKHPQGMGAPLAFTTPPGIVHRKKSPASWAKSLPAYMIAPHDTG